MSNPISPRGAVMRSAVNGVETFSPSFEHKSTALSVSARSFVAA